jgi:hypothetical protein
VESSCECGYEPPGSIKCWDTVRWQFSISYSRSWDNAAEVSRPVSQYLWSKCWQLLVLRHQPYRSAWWIDTWLLALNKRMYAEQACMCLLCSKCTPWPDSASELYRRSDRRLSAKLVPTFADRRSALTAPYGRILGFLDRNRYFFFQVDPQLYSQAWKDPVLDPLLFRECGSAGNRTWTSGFVARNSGH